MSIRIIQKEINVKNNNRAKINNGFKSCYRFNAAIEIAAKQAKMKNSEFLRMVVAKAINFEGETL